jgi:hypothetical protein
MAINLIFQVQAKVFMIRIDGKSIYWNDEKSGLHRLYPTPDIVAVRMGGKPTEQELKEYNLCKTEDELASFIIRDCLQKGFKLIKREVTNGE